MNIQSALVLAIVAAAVLLAIRVRKKSGGCKCGNDKDCCKCSGSCNIGKR